MTEKFQESLEMEFVVLPVNENQWKRGFTSNKADEILKKHNEIDNTFSADGCSHVIEIVHLKSLSQEEQKTDSYKAT